MAFRPLISFRYTNRVMAQRCLIIEVEYWDYWEWTRIKLSAYTTVLHSPGLRLALLNHVVMDMHLLSFSNRGIVARRIYPLSLEHPLHVDY
jgi:hypothetical protein